VTTERASVVEVRDLLDELITIAWTKARDEGFG
jgi:hypothetical protein